MNEVRQAVDLAGQIGPLLADKGPGIQGAALAELTATWLAGHFAGDAEATNEMREALLENWLKTVRELIPACEAEVLRFAHALRNSP